MFSIFNSLSKKNILFFAFGFFLSPVVSLSLFNIYPASVMVSKKNPLVPPISPPVYMVEYFGATNITAQKYPINIWRINEKDLMDKVEEAFEKGLLTMGANNTELKMGDYLMFNSNGSEKWGYVEDKLQIENTYIFTKE